MDIEVQTELKPKYAHFQCRGTFNADAMLQMYERAFQFASSERRNAVLFDMRGMTGEPFTVMERYRAGEHIAELQKGIGAGIAFAAVGNAPMIDPQKFAETVGVNRGGNGRAFLDIDEAVDWIENTV
jgi:hypothetical protein